MCTSAVFHEVEYTETCRGNDNVIVIINKGQGKVALIKQRRLQKMPSAFCISPYVGELLSRNEKQKLFQLLAQLAVQFGI